MLLMQISLPFLRSRFLPLIMDDSCLKVIIGTKADLITNEERDQTSGSPSMRQVSPEVAKKFSDEINTYHQGSSSYLPVFETSSKTDKGINETFQFIFEKCLGKIASDYTQPISSSTIKLTDRPEQSGTTSAAAPKRKCCSH